MPTNYARTEREGPKDDRLRRRGLKRADAFARKLAAAGRTSWRSIPLLPEFVKGLGRGPRAGPGRLSAGSTLSRSMWKSARGAAFAPEVCPVSNITMETFPRFGVGCLFCQRCVSLCPREAIGVRGRSPLCPTGGSNRREMLEWPARASTTINTETPAKPPGEPGTHI